MELVFRIAAIGVLLAILSMVLKRSGRDDIAELVVLVGVIAALLMVVESIGGLFNSIRGIFLI